MNVLLFGEIFAMQFESKAERNFWTKSLLGLIPDLVIAFVVAYLTDSGIIGFIAVLVAVQILYIMIWLKNLLWSWLAFWLGGRKTLASHLLNYLRDHEYPKPARHYGNVEDYFLAVAEDESQPVELRLKAAKEFGSMEMIRQSLQMGRYMQTNMAYEDAIEQYERSFAPRNRRD